MKTLLLPLLILFATGHPLQAETLPRWQFPEGTVVNYKVEQQTTIDTDDGATSITNSIGAIEIKSIRRMGALDFELKVTEAMIRGNQLSPEDVAHIPPTIYRAALAPDGKLLEKTTADDKNLQLLLALTFPLPEEPFSPGNPVTQKISMKTSGDMSDLQGQAVFTHRGHKTIDGDKYLSFTVDCTLATPLELAAAPFQPTPPKSSVTAKIECLFDEKLGYFYSARNTIKMDMSMASPNNPSQRLGLKQAHILKVQIISEGG